MNLLGKFGYTQNVVPKEPVVDLTPIGKQKVNLLEGSGPDFVIMVKLSDRGPCDAKELASVTGYDVEKVKEIINILGRKKFIQRIN